jgi:hypothetical protein
MRCRSAGQQRKEISVRNFLVTLLVLAGIAISISVASAQQVDACKECRDFQRACLQAHSKAACKIDYDICMKHCRK